MVAKFHRLLLKLLDERLIRLQFFNDYSSLKGRPFWVSGESYGGHYVPELVNRILMGNEQHPNQQINIQGFLAGNAWTFMPIDNQGAIFDWWSHAIISDESYIGMIQNCDFSNIGPLADPFGKPFKLGKDPAKCNQFVNTAFTEMGNINIYDIYVDVCTQNRKTFEFLAGAGSIFHQAVLKAVGGIWPPYHPCGDNYVTTYMNQNSVKSALHAKPSITWGECSNIVNYNYSDVEASVIPLYQKFIAKYPNLQILVYSGDVDAIVPVTGTRAWLRSLHLPIVKPWRPWYDSRKQVGGYVTVYKGLTFTTVRNAGHMVPETQPERAFNMFSKFIKGIPY